MPGVKGTNAGGINNLNFSSNTALVHIVQICEQHMWCAALERYKQATTAEGANEDLSVCHGANVGIAVFCASQD